MTYRVYSDIHGLYVVTNIYQYALAKVRELEGQGYSAWIEKEG